MTNPEPFIMLYGQSKLYARTTNQPNNEEEEEDEAAATR